MTDADPALDISPERVLLDEPVAIEVTGVEPGCEVTIAVETTSRGALRRGEATFRADDSGRIDVGAQPPIRGCYDGVKPMGLFTYAEEVAESEPDAADPGVRPTSITAAAGGDEIDFVEIERRSRAAGVDRVPVDDNVEGELFLPEGPGPHPGVVVLGGSEGGIPDDFRAPLLASHGYATLALAYFGVGELPDGLHEIPVEYVVGAIDWLTGRAEVVDGQVGVVGGSRGAELALLVGATSDRVGVVVGHAASGVVFQGTGPSSAWTIDGEPVPFVPIPPATWDLLNEQSGTAVFGEVYREAFESADSGTVEAATIPVEEIDGPVLLISGSDDRMWPADDLSVVAIDRLRREDHPYDVDHRRYDGAGHAILAPYLPVTGRSVGEEDGPFGLPVELGGSPAGYERADADSWPAVLAALESGLGK